MKHSPEQFLRKVTGYWISQSIYVAAKLGVADELIDGPQTAQALAPKLECDAGSLHRVLRLLCTEEIFRETEQGFELTPFAQHLRSDSATSMRAAVCMYGEQAFQAWGNLLHTVKTGETGFDHHFEKPVFDYYEDHPDASETFNQAMTDLGRTMYSNQAMIDAYDFSKHHVIVDVGGGHGDFLCDILTANPESRGAVYDLEHVIAGAATTIDEKGLTARADVERCDFFKEVMPGGDAYLLKRIIHDWDDTDAVKILKNCACALQADGRVLVVETVIPPGNEPFFGKNLDLHMMMITGGLERTEEEYRTLFSKAGLDLVRVVPTDCPLSIVEARIGAV